MKIGPLNSAENNDSACTNYEVWLSLAAVHFLTVWAYGHTVTIGWLGRQYPIQPLPHVVRAILPDWAVLPDRVWPGDSTSPGFTPTLALSRQ